MVAADFTETYSTTILQLDLLQIHNFELHIATFYKTLSTLEALPVASGIFTMLYLQVSVEQNT